MFSHTNLDLLGIGKCSIIFHPYQAHNSYIGSAYICTEAAMFRFSGFSSHFSADTLPNIMEWNFSARSSQRFHHLITTEIFTHLRQMQLICPNLYHHPTSSSYASSPTHFALHSPLSKQHCPVACCVLRCPQLHASISLIISHAAPFAI